MDVVWLFLKVTDWCVWLIGWIFCIPLRIQINVLRWIHPHFVASITIDEKKSKDIKIIQDLHRQLNQAIEDKKHASTQDTEMKNDVSHLKYKCECMKKENEQLEQGNQRLREKCQRLQQEYDILQQTTQKEIDAIRQGVDEDVKKLHQKDSDISEFKKSKDSLTSGNTNLKLQLPKLNEKLKNAHGNLKSLIDPHLVASITTDEKKSNVIRIEASLDAKDLQCQLHNAVEDKKHASAQFIEMKNDISHLNYECERLKKEKEQLEQGNQWLRKKCQKLKETESDSSRWANLKDELENAHECLRALKVEIESVQNKLQEEITKYESAENGNSQLKTKINHIEKQAAATLRQANMKKEQVVKSLKVEIASIQNKLQEEITKYESAENGNSQLKTKINHIEKQAAATLRQAHMNKEQVVKSLKIEIASVQNKLQEEITKYESAENENSQLKTKINHIEKQAAETLSYLRQANMKKEQVVKSLRIEIGSVKNQLQEEKIKYDTDDKGNSQLKAKVTDVEKQNTETLSNLRQTETEKEDGERSEMMSLRLRDSNPNKEEISDPFRPTKLAGMMNKLYDNQWTDLFSYLEDNWDSADGQEFSDTMCIEFLLNILMETYTFCRNRVIDDWTDCISKIFWTADTKDEQELLKNMKDARKKNALLALPIIQQQCHSTLQKLRLTNDGVFGINAEEEVEVQAYINECVRSCWYMSLQDPPVCLVCEGWESNQDRQVCDAIEAEGMVELYEDNQVHDTQGEIRTFSKSSNALLVEEIGNEHDRDDRDARDEMNQARTNKHYSGISGEHDVYKREAQIDVLIRKPLRRPFEKDLYKKYTKRGQYLDYIVWPLMYLHENGPVLNKGVAQVCT